ncbi:putative C3HC4 type zinc-finger protein [Tomelloso virus]|uniref:Putative C3HC4 type zinc-finger protein n=1 Tax=Tomelloso virus TaxID=2053981 RepID=A0A2H4T2R9_9VIRU|nr:putative C3HC4 type zinc-finger protein [Tomelloso virus]ATY70222.1 putative C3HC4 type zinc-finger protein [Tomelloso virus]
MSSRNLMVFDYSSSSEDEIGIIEKYKNTFNTKYNSSAIPELNIQQDSNVDQPSSSLNAKLSEAQEYIKRIRKAQKDRDHVLHLKRLIYKHTQTIAQLKKDVFIASRELQERGQIVESSYNDLLSISFDGQPIENSPTGEVENSPTTEVGRTLEERRDSEKKHPFELLYKYKTQCPICLEDKPGSEMIFSHDCVHSVCKECTTQLSNNHCPVCRVQRRSLYCIEIVHSLYILKMYNAEYMTRAPDNYADDFYDDVFYENIVITDSDSDYEPITNRRPRRGRRQYVL